MHNILFTPNYPTTHAWLMIFVLKNDEQFAEQPTSLNWLLIIYNHFGNEDIRKPTLSCLHLNYSPTHAWLVKICLKEW